MRVLVTGGAGFIGSHLVERLIGEGVDVDVLDLLHPAAHRAAPQYLPAEADITWGDVRDSAVVRRLVRRADAVAHLSSMVGLGTNFGDVTDYVGHNDLGTAVLLSALYESSFTGRLVLASSMVVYGEGRYRCRVHGSTRPGARTEEALGAGDFEPRCPECSAWLLPEPIDEDAPPDPRNVYAATKLHQEHLGMAFGRERRVPVTVLRYHNVYGPRMPHATPYAGVAAVFRSALQDGRPPRMFEDGGQMRDFIHVDDVARATAMALVCEPGPPGVFNIATGRPRSVSEMAVELCRATSPGSPQPVVTGEYRLGDVRHVFAAAERAADAFGFSADVRFEEGMRQFANDALR